MPDTAIDVIRPPAQPEPAPPAVLSGVVATEPRWRRGFGLVESYLPDATTAIDEDGPEVYRRMERDPEIRACLFQIKRRILGRTLVFEPGVSGDPLAEEIAEYCRSVIRTEVDIRHTAGHLLRAISRRYAVGQVVYRLDDGRHGRAGVWVPDHVIAEDEQKFGVRRDTTLVLKDGILGGTPLTPPAGPLDRKFIVHRNEPEPTAVAGTSVLDGVYWAWRMLSEGLGYWLDLLDRFGVPSLIALFDGVGDDDAKAQQVADALAVGLSNVASGSSGAIAAREIVVPTAGGRGADFEAFARFLEKRIRKGILSTTLTVDVSDVGARAQGEVSEREVDGVAEWYAQDLATTIERTLVRWTAAFRYGEDPKTAALFPRVRFDFHRHASLDEYLDAAAAGAEVSKGALYSVYNVPKPAGPDDVFIAREGLARTAGSGSGLTEFADREARRTAGAGAFFLPTRVR